MPNCEILETGITRRENFLVSLFGYQPLFCPEAKNCPYKNGIVGKIGEWKYSLCKTHGQIEKVNLENLSISEETFTKQPNQPPA